MKPTQLTEPERTVVELAAAGYDLSDIDSLRERKEDEPCSAHLFNEARKKLGAKSAIHAVALAIRGGHIL
jgi:DNA-binding CsgD family transcriptional regulator